MEQRTLWNKNHMFLQIYFVKLIVLCEEILLNFRRCCHVFCRFKGKDYNKLLEIYFLTVHWDANKLHAIYLWNMYRAICFVGVRRAYTCMFLTEKFVLKSRVERVFGAGRTPCTPEPSWGANRWWWHSCGRRRGVQEREREREKEMLLNIYIFFWMYAPRYIPPFGVSGTTFRDPKLSVVTIVQV